MIKFLKNIVVFSIITIIIGEAVVRFSHATSDIPQRMIDEQGIQKYYPKQEGYWKGGDHKWLINKLGWPGILPDNYDNLVMVIGDSYIENFMNPNECHQAIYLKENIKDYNFMEAGRSGVSLIEAMEISKTLDYLKPIKNLIYVNDNDFYESISEIKPLADISQLNIEKNIIIHGKMKAPGLKKILYNWKLLYYFYNRFPISLSTQKKRKEEKKDTQESIKALEGKVSTLINYISNHYNINDKILVFHPNSKTSIIEKCKAVGFKIIVLDSSNDKDWTFDYDTHWTCYGHERAAKQIAKVIEENNFNSCFKKK